MIIRNAAIFTSENHFVTGDLVIRDGRILRNTAEEQLLGETGPAAPEPFGGEEVLDASGLYALPGLVDLHFHGAAGHDFSDGDYEGLKEIAAFEASQGVLAICPATMTLPEERLYAVMDNAASFRYSQENALSGSFAQDGLSHLIRQPAADTFPSRGSQKKTALADLVGIHLEGPFISREKAGAQDPMFIIPADEALFRRLQARCGNLIRLVDLAPEIPENMAFIRTVLYAPELYGPVRISLAHTACDYDTARAAFAAGACHMTHIFNAMPGISHRAPGPVIAALEAGADAELIADGVHIHPAMVRFTFSTFGAEHVILISDSMEATGLPDGSYTLGGQQVTVEGKKAVLQEHPDTIAGSVTNLYDCMKTAVLEMGVPLPDAVRAATRNPAEALGIDQDYGSLSAGRYGNVILADRELNRRRIIQRGRVISQS